MDYRYRVENDTETYRGFFRVRRYTVAYERYREALDWLAAGKLDNANTLIAMQAFLLRHPHLAAQQHPQATL